MFYKIRNILLILLSFVLTSVEAKAQGVVSLSEEALFEDELDTEIIKKKDAPEISAEVPVISSEKNDTPEVIVTPSATEKEPKPNDDIKKEASPFDSIIKKNSENETKPSEVSVSDEINADIYKLLDGKTDLKDSDVFNHMTDIEKRTAILNLELRREKLQNEIEAAKYKRREALAKEKQQEEEQRLKNLAAEKEIERKTLEEQARLKELDLEFEELRQEKLLASYKNKMLEETQKWIDHNNTFYTQIGELRSNNKKIIENTKSKFNTLKEKAIKQREEFVKTVTDYEKRISDKDSQLSILRSRIANLEKEIDAAKKNPFAGFDKAQLAAAAGIDLDALDAFINQNQLSTSVNGTEPVENDLSKLYRVTEIRGKGDELIARLINKNDVTFYVKKGTSLQSGHVISEITTTYVLAEKDNEKQYLYFAAGGILPTEIPGDDKKTDDKETKKQ